MVMSSNPPPEGNPNVNDNNHTITLDLSKIDDMSNDDLKAVIKNQNLINVKINTELEDQRKYREEQQKKASDIAMAEYTIERDKIMVELKKASPELAELHKDSHKDRLTDLLEGASINTNKLPLLGGNQQNNDDNPPEVIHYAYDPLKGNRNNE